MTTKPLDNHSADNHHDARVHPNNNRADVIQWQCLNCGQHIFGVIDVEPPDTCEYCQDMTTWQFVEK